MAHAEELPWLAKHHGEMSDSVIDLICTQAADYIESLEEDEPATIATCATYPSWMRFTGTVQVGPYSFATVQREIDEDWIEQAEYTAWKEWTR